MLLSLKIGIARAAVDYLILERTFGLEPLGETTAPKVDVFEACYNTQLLPLS